MAPRGFGVLTAMLLVSRLIGRLDNRLVLLSGLIVTAFSNWQMTTFDGESGDVRIMMTGFIHGLGLGVLFVPMNTITFSTIPEALRAEAATVNTIVRNVGGSVGIALMQAMIAINTARSSQAPTTNDPDGFSPAPASALFLHKTTQHALLQAYAQDFYWMVWIAICCIPLLLFIRRPTSQFEATALAGTRSEESEPAAQS